MATTPTTPAVGTQRPVPSEVLVPNPSSGQQFCVVCGQGSHRKDWEKNRDGFVACDFHTDEQFASHIEKAKAQNATKVNAAVVVPPVKVVPRAAPLAPAPASPSVLTPPSPAGPGTNVPAAVPKTPPSMTGASPAVPATPTEQVGAAQATGQVTTGPVGIKP